MHKNNVKKYLFHPLFVYSPCYIDSTVDLPIATRRILWGKLANAGQTCVAPDYVLCTADVQKAFLTEARKVLATWYGDNPEESAHLGRIVNATNFEFVLNFWFYKIIFNFFF